jgi:hypothetical protein
MLNKVFANYMIFFKNFAFEKRLCITHMLLFFYSNLYFIMILLSIYIYNWIGNKFLQLTSPSPYKYINSINKTNQMTANVQAISIIISKLSKIMSN